jgi:hypothetical protein
MQSAKNHWNKIFSKKTDHEFGLYENDISQTTKFFKNMELSSRSNVFLPGAGTSYLVDELLKTGCHLILNDISDRALNNLSDRIGSGNFDFLHHDMSLKLPQKYEADIWIDRATLHFILKEEDILQYFKNLRKTINSDGYVLLAEFSKLAVTRCAGLETRQYSVSEMQFRLGEKFKLISSEEYVFINSLGEEKPYIYALFQKKID